MKLVFFGTAEFSTPYLEALISAKNWEIEAVVTRPDTAKGRGRKVTAPQVKNVATNHSIPCLQPASKQDLVDMLKHYPDVEFGLVAAFGMILPSQVLDHFKKGLVNVHPSLLPRWRGPSPIEAAILNGDQNTGVSLIRLNEEMDAGPIYSQKEIKLRKNETRLSLADRLSRIGIELIRSDLEKIFAGQLKPKAQLSTGITYSRLISRQDSVVDWHDDATQIERHVRAYLGWPGSKSTLYDQAATITAAHTIKEQGPPGQPFITKSNDLAVYCYSDALVIDRLIPEGKKEISGSDFVKGYVLNRNN